MRPCIPELLAAFRPKAFGGAATGRRFWTKRHVGESKSVEAGLRRGGLWMRWQAPAPNGAFMVFKYNGRDEAAFLCRRLPSLPSRIPLYGTNLLAAPQAAAFDLWTACRFGNRRYSRLGNLRYGSRKMPIRCGARRPKPRRQTYARIGWFNLVSWEFNLVSWTFRLVSCWLGWSPAGGGTVAGRGSMVSRVAP